MSRKVYMVTNAFLEDGIGILGIFATREDAEQYASDYNARFYKPDRPDWEKAVVTDEDVWGTLEEARAHDEEIERRIREARK